MKRPVALGILRRRVRIEDKGWGPPRKIKSDGDLTGKTKLSPPQLRALDKLIDNKDVTYHFASEKALREYLGGSRDRRLVQIIDHRSPDLSPPHYERPMDVSDTVYQLSGASVPAYYDMPQSPRNDDSERETTRVSVAPTLAQLSSGLQATKKRPRAQTGIKTTASTNIFKFSVQVDFRVTEMMDAPDGWVLGDETEHTIAKESQIYQSSGTDLPAHEDDEANVKRRKFDKAVVNDRVRGAVVQANELGYQFKQFAPLAVQAYPLRGGLNDWGDAQRKRKGKYVLTNPQLASACFHSETQALGMAPVEVPPLITSLIDSIVAGLPTTGDGLQVVINSLMVHGASVPNSVCSNACKPALLQLLNQIEDSFVTTYKMQKPSLRKRGIYFRRSGEYVAAMNVAGLTKFQGYGTGAKAIKKVTVPVHGVVYEFPPD